MDLRLTAATEAALGAGLRRAPLHYPVSRAAYAPPRPPALKPHTATWVRWFCLSRLPFWPEARKRPFSRVG